VIMLTSHRHRHALFTGGKLFPNSELGPGTARMDAEKWASAQ